MRTSALAATLLVAFGSSGFACSIDGSGGDDVEGGDGGGGDGVDAGGGAVDAGGGGNPACSGKSGAAGNTDNVAAANGGPSFNIRTPAGYSNDTAAPLLVVYAASGGSRRTLRTSRYRNKSAPSA